MAKAGELLSLYSLRLKMNDEGLTKWTPALRAAVEDLVEELNNITPDETVEIDANVDRDPMARFIRAATGKLLGEIPSQLADGFTPDS